MKASIYPRASFPRHDISMAFRFGELLGGVCSFSIIYGQRGIYSWATRAMHAEPHASCWICRSVRQQSVEHFNELRKQKLINLDYCLQQYYH